MEVAMKWILLIGVALFTTGCVCSTAQVVEYQQVNVVNVVSPAVYDVDYPDSIDVTDTEVDYY